MFSVKRHAIPVLATSIALLGVAYVQPAGAVTRSSGTASTGGPLCEQLATADQAGYLELCVSSNDETLTATNVAGDDDDGSYFVLLATNNNPQVVHFQMNTPYYQIPMDDDLSGLVRTAVVSLDGKIRTDIAQAFNPQAGERVAVAPGQTLTVTSTQPLTGTDVSLGYDRAAALMAVIAGSLAENFALKFLSEEDQAAHAMVECVKYIRNWVANGGGGKVASGNILLQAWNSHWSNESGQQECAEFASYFNPEETTDTDTKPVNDDDAGNGKSVWHKLYDQVKDNAKDAAKDTFYDVIPDVWDYFEAVDVR
jgi:hypothetical protein